MRTDVATRELLVLYPKIYFVCHQRHVRDPATDGVLSAHQASILSHLDEVEPTRLTELAEHMGVSLSTMSLAIKRLVGEGYVVREQDPSDRRQVALRLTEAGVRMKDAQTVLDEGIVASMLGRLSTAERAQAIQGLDLLAGAAAEEMKTRAKARRPA